MSYQCVLRCGRPCKSSDIITQGKWDSVQSKSQNWSGLDKFGDVHDSTAWKNGPDGYYMHKACYITLSSSTILKKPSNVNRKKVILLNSQVWHCVQKNVNPRECHNPSAYVHQWVDLFMRKWSVFGACRVKMQNTQIDHGINSLE